MVTVTTRLPAGLQRSGGWGSTEIELPPGVFMDHFTGATWSGTVRLAELLVRLPVALLERSAPSGSAAENR